MTQFQIGLAVTWPSGPSILSPLSKRMGAQVPDLPGTQFSTMHGASQAYWDTLKLYTARNIRTHAQVTRKFTPTGHLTCCVNISRSERCPAKVSMSLH
jgi:hypothetical protein